MSSLGHYAGASSSANSNKGLSWAEKTDRRLDKIEKSLESVKHHLAILDEPSPELLEKNKALKKAYKKYKMIEALIGEQNNE